MSNGQYRYCRQICPVWDAVLTFCGDRVKQTAFVTGNGGMGKTALILSILNELFQRPSAFGFTNLIFFSAKKKYYSLDRDSLSYQQNDNAADIGSYADFTEKLSNLLDVGTDGGDVDLLIERINAEAEKKQSAKRFLLVVDDLDSMNIADQQKIADFLYRLNASCCKSIVTTRNIQESNPVSFQLKELSEQGVEDFTLWYIRQIMGYDPPSRWSRKDDAVKTAKQLGEGSPLQIQILLALVSLGNLTAFDADATAQERAMYLYNTVMNLLNDEEKIVFEICRMLVISLPKDEQERELMRSIPKYLAAGCKISADSFAQCFDRLVKLKLFVVSQNGDQFRPTSVRILRDPTIIPMGEIVLPEMYRLVWEDVSKRPNEWSSSSQIEEVIVDCLCAAESQRQFNTLIARRIFESLSMYENLYPTVRNKIQPWLEAHSIHDPEKNPLSVMRRLIEQIEADWGVLKPLLDTEGASNDQINALKDRIRGGIQKLRGFLREHAGEDPLDEQISARLQTVRAELREYDI